jgi:uncharacterized protein (TIGR02466 family)
MQGEILQLFPTPVGKLNFRSPTPDEWAIIKRENSFLSPNTGNKISRNHNILDLDGMQGLRKDLTQLINEYFEALYAPESPVSLYITTSWTNVSYQNDFHHEHNHANSFISGSYYLEAEPYDGIFFVKNDLTMYGLHLSTRMGEDNIFNFKKYSVEVEKNNVVLFPSMLVHGVAPVKATGPRITLSFNTFLTGKIGSERALTQLTLR